MKDLLYNLDSVSVSYGDNSLPSIIQIEERIDEIIALIRTGSWNDYEKTETADRLQKIIELNNAIQIELQKQQYRLIELKNRLMINTVTHHF